MAENNIAPFIDLREPMLRYWENMHEAMRIEYAIADKNKIDKSLGDVQEKIYERFCLGIKKGELQTFKINFATAVLQRDKILADYVNRSVSEIKTWKGNNSLGEEHYLVTQAQDIITGQFDKRIVQVDGFCDETTIDGFLKNKMQDFGPEFKRRFGKSLNKDEIEVHSVSNLTKIGSKFSSYGRNKNSKRELIKFLDWILGLRPKDDFPYDDIGQILVTPDFNPDGKIGGEHIYMFANFIIDLSKKQRTPRPYNANKLTPEEIAELPKNVVVHKLKDTYSFSNYMNVMQQMKDTERRIIKRRSKEIIVKPHEVQMLLQGHQYKHIVSNHVGTSRTETWVMNNTMHSFYTGELIGHNQRYIDRRLKERNDYLENPALSPAYKEETGKLYKGKIPESRKNAKLPSVDILAMLLENKLEKYFGKD